MLKTKQPFALVKLWKNINQSWGVAVGFLMLLFIIPFAIIVSDQSKQNLTNSNADASKPLVIVSPQQGQGTKSQFIAEVRDTDVNKLQSVDLWFGTSTPNTVNGNYATISLKNFTVGTDSDWRANVYKTESGVTTNITTLLPDDNASSNLSKIYSTPTNNADILLSTTDSATATASIKYRKVEKVSANTVRFYLDVEFKNNFSDKNINIYMKAQRGEIYGGATSSIGNNLWTNVGSWIVSTQSSGASVACSNNTAPKFTTAPITKATVGNLYQYKLGAVDPEDDAFKFEITSNNPPSFLSIIGGTTLSGTPTTANVGSFPIEITVIDTCGNSSTQSWTLVVSQPAATPAPTTVAPTTAAPTTAVATTTPTPTKDTSNIQSPRLTRRTPEESVITDTKPTISATVNAGSGDVDMSTLAVSLDGQDITSKVDKGVNTFSYKPLNDLSYATHTVKVSVKGKDAVDDKGVLNDSWTFTISQNLPGSDNQSSTTTVNKIRLPILNILVDQWLGTLIIAVFVILLFAILIIAIIALIRTLKGKDSDMDQITKYYQHDDGGTPPSLGSANSTTSLASPLGTAPTTTKVEEPAKTLPEPVLATPVEPTLPEPKLTEPTLSTPVESAEVIHPKIVTETVSPVTPAKEEPWAPQDNVLDVTSNGNLDDLKDMDTKTVLTPEEAAKMDQINKMGGTESQTFKNPELSADDKKNLLDPNAPKISEPYDPFKG